MKPYGRKEASNICQCCYCKINRKSSTWKTVARAKAKKEIKIELQNAIGRRKKGNG